MKKILWPTLFFLFFAGLSAKKMPDKKQIISCMTSVNDRFMKKHPIAGDSIRLNGVHPSNNWTRSVYMEGLIALNEVNPQPHYIEYAIDWGVANLWGFPGGAHTRKAENQCCAQTYIDLYRWHENALVLGNTERMLNNVVNSTERNDWQSTDALQMAMPIYAKMGNIKKDIRYFHTLRELYSYVRNDIEQIGLFNIIDNLWWHDAGFIPTYKEPNGQNCYWSRGNGWAFAGLARTIEEICMAEELFPNDADRLELASLKKMLTDDFVNMAIALMKCQRKDGFWNCSLADSLHYGGRETTGTALFVYGMAWGICHDILSPKVFGSGTIRAWNALMKEAVHPDGTLGYMQGTGKEPKDGQPTGYDRQPDFEDFGTGCFLLAGSEMVKLTYHLKGKEWKVPQPKAK